MKKFFYRLFVSLIALFAVSMFGANANVLMAAGTDAIDGNGSGATENSKAPDNRAADGGVASVTHGQQESPELYETDLENAILVLDPMGTAGLTLIDSEAQSREIDSLEFEFYSIGPRSLRTTTTAAVAAGDIATDRFILKVADSGFAGKDDTIRVVGVKGLTATGALDSKDLMLVVIDRAPSSGNLICYAKNGTNGAGGQGFLVSTSSGNNTYIPAGTNLVLMAKSCPESAAQTSRAHAAPTSERGFVQNFMLQIEQTEFDRLTKKRVAWDFNDIVEWNMRNYKVVKQNTYFWGVGGLDRHNAHELEDNYNMTGIWWQAGRSLEIGHIAVDASGNTLWEDDANGNPALLCTITTVESTTTYKLGDTTITGSAKSSLVNGEYYYLLDATSGSEVIAAALPKVEIDGKDLVAFNKQAFIGNGGSQVKYLIAGCNVIEAFDNIKGKQYETKDIVTENNLIVQNFKTSFGTIKLVYDKLFDINGMANAAFMLDKQYLRKVVFKPLSKDPIDFKKSGQRNSQGVILQEVNAIYLQYADAHARVWLAGRTDVYDYVVAGKYDASNTTSFSGSYSQGTYANGHKQADFS